MTELRCQDCQAVVQEIEDGTENIEFFTDVCPFCGFNPSA